MIELTIEDGTASSPKSVKLECPELDKLIAELTVLVKSLNILIHFSIEKEGK